MITLEEYRNKKQIKIGDFVLSKDRLKIFDIHRKKYIFNRDEYGVSQPFSFDDINCFSMGEIELSKYYGKLDDIASAEEEELYWNS